MLFLPGFCTLAANALQAADSIMGLVISNAAGYQKLLASSEAEIYIKGRTKILQRNVLLRFGHHLFPVNRNVSDMVFEMNCLSRFEAPNTFFHDFIAVTGSHIPNRQKQQEILNFLSLNIYSPTAFNNEVLMPIAKNAFKYYDFQLTDSGELAGDKIYRIRFLPKQISQKLISGYLYVVDNVWTISRIELSGGYYFSNFTLAITYGNETERLNLPETADLSLTYRLLGNTVSSVYHSRYNYKSIVRAGEDTGRNEDRKGSLNLSSHYRQSSDTIPIIADSLYWQQLRDLPLSADEIRLYADATDRRVQTSGSSASTAINPYLTFTELITNPVSADYHNTYIRYYGILNPSQIGYSKSAGISYRQRLKVQKRYLDETELGCMTELGFVSRRREVFYKAEGYWEYRPERLGRLWLRAGNGNQSYSLSMMREINNQPPDSTPTAGNVDPPYFRHHYVDIGNQIDLFNGFHLTTTLTYNHRNPVNRQFDVSYHDFTSTIGFSFTPRSYYRINGRRKIYIFSHYPTLSVEFAKAIPGIWKGRGDYERIEADLQQSLSLGLLQRFNYHVSAGMYTSKKSAYFADFRYFTRRNFPDTWDDQIGGVFNLLEREWFYASDQYVQVHLMYQNPFLLLPLFEKAATKYVFAERLYLSQLWTPALPSYTEMGYGVGNHLFNLAAFVAFRRLAYQSVGVKIVFELF
jgi:hypothetical protein